jgi:hypothetical protein
VLSRLKLALVESYVGAIALGYLMAEGIISFGGIFAAPVGTWISRNEFPGLAPSGTLAPFSAFESALPYLIRFVVYLVVWYALLRWLYFTPLQREASEASASSQQSGE